MFKFLSTFLLFFLLLGLIFLSFFYNPSVYKNFILNTLQKYIPYQIKVGKFDFLLNPNFVFFIEDLNIQDKENHTNYTFSKISFIFSTSDILRKKLTLKKISILGGASNIFIGGNDKQGNFWGNPKVVKFLSFLEEIENIEIKNYLLSVSSKNRKNNFYFNLLSLKFPYYLKNYHRKTNIKVDGKWNGAGLETSLNFSIDKDEIRKKFYSLGFNQETYSFFYQKTDFEIQAKIDDLHLYLFSNFFKPYLPYLNLSQSFLFVDHLELKKKRNKNLFVQAQLRLNNYILSNQKNDLTLSFHSDYSLFKNQINVKEFYLNVEKKFILFGNGNYFLNQSSYFNIHSNQIDYDSFMDFVNGFYIEYDSQESSNYPIKIDVKVKKFFYENLLFENVSLNMNYEDKFLEFRNIESDFYEGGLYSNFSINFKEKESIIKGSVSYSQVNAKELILVFSDKNFITGEMRADFTFSSTFTDGDDLLKNLKLRGNSLIYDFDIDEDLDFRTLIALRFGSLINFTQYIEEDNILSLNYFIEQEKFHIRSIEILNTSADLIGSGYIEFNGNTNINLSAKYGGTFIGNVLKIPVQYTGNLNKELKVKINFAKPAFRIAFSFYGSALFVGYASYIYRGNISPFTLLIAGLGGGVLSASVYDYFSDIWKNFYSKQVSNRIK